MFSFSLDQIFYLSGPCENLWRCQPNHRLCWAWLINPLAGVDCSGYVYTSDFILLDDVEQITASLLMHTSKPLKDSFLHIGSETSLEACFRVALTHTLATAAATLD
jgi:hypothetical protein